MALNSHNKSSFDPLKQLELLNTKCVSLSSDIYKINSFYLSLIRSMLPDVVKEAVLHLILSTQNNSRSLSIDNSNTSFLEKIDETLSKHLSYLTLQNLLLFSEKLEKQKQKQKQKDVKRLLLSNKDLLEKDQFDSSSNSENYNSSLDLSLDLPTENKIDFTRWNLSSEKLHSCNYNYENTLDLFVGEDEEIVEVETEEGSLESNDLSSSEKDLDLVKSIFLVASNMFASKTNTTKHINKNDSLLDPKDKNVQVEDSLPSEPEELFKWMSCIDLALNRTLRDLSHSINIELIKIGVINSFIPTNLLDAVIAGQVASVHAPSNILRLRLPMSPALDNEIDIECLLIRPSELEFDHLKLKQCRQQITEQRNSLIKMMRQQRYWQNRSLANDVREQWLKNTQTNKQIKRS
ncbi:putative Adenylate cyclase [Prochlorococcus sp. MIT 0602]|nr:putative Adenylate cyclase [Prochlorococcus sp. MIT 0602]